ncbi:MAG: hypothetical protein ABI664_20615 [bacterium]
MIKPTRFLSIAAVALLSACGSDAGTGPNASTPVNLATAFSEMSLPGLSAVASLTGGVAAPTTSGVPSGCSYVAASQNFVCPSVTASGVTITSNYALLDASGHQMSTFDANAVSALRVKSTVVGTVTVSGDVLTIDGQQDQTLSGLQTATHTLNGTNTLNFSGTLTSAAIPGPINTHSTTTISNVVLPANGSATPYPTSGTVTVDQTTSLVGSASLTSRLVLTFNGTSKVAVALTLDGQTLPVCTIDLSKALPSCSASI